MEGAALAGAGQRDRPRKGGKRTKASKAQELFEEEVKRLVKLIDVKLTLQGLRNVVEYEEALKSALASSASGTYGGMGVTAIGGEPLDPRGFLILNARGVFLTPSGPAQPAASAATGRSKNRKQVPSAI